MKTMPDPTLDLPTPRRRFSPQTTIEIGGSAAAAFAAMWVIFTVTGVSAPLGLVVASLLTFLIIYGVVCRRRYGTFVMKDRLATVGIWMGGLVALSALAAVMIYVVIKGAAVALGHFPHFFVADMSQLSATSPPSAVGAGAAIVGTIEQVALATALTVPLGVLTATYLVDSRSAFSRIVNYVVDAMTGAPAIIAGLFVYLLWVVPHHHTGKSGFAAALALAVMMLPTVTRTAEEVVAIVPGSYREAALALGAPQWRVMMRVVLPTARAGLATAIILGVARIAGETAPVLFNAGGNSHYNWNPFSGQQDDLPFRVYQLIFQPGTNVVADAWGVSFVLVMVVLALFVLARRLGGGGPGRRSIFARLRSRFASKASA